MALKYLFSLRCDSIISEYAGEVPAGSRVHIRYCGGELWTKPDPYRQAWLAELSRIDDVFAKRLSEASPIERAATLRERLAECKSEHEAEALRAVIPMNWWLGLDGSILSGIDWALVRTDGVASFDARLTLSAKTGGDGDFLIEALMSGAVDLDPTAPHTIEAGRKTYGAWKSGGLADAIPLALGVRFEATGAAPPDASAEYKRKVEHFPRFMRLTRCQCLALGELKLVARGGWKAIQQIDLGIYEHVA